MTLKNGIVTGYKDPKQLSAGKAAAGGILFGPVGAVVGMSMGVKQKPIKETAFVCDNKNCNRVVRWQDA
jgi:hypothetical protein